jgi:hypothetical protein
MVTVKICGGLGNQMFQYAVARHLALKHRCEVALDAREYALQKKRTFDLGAFKLAENIVICGAGDLPEKTSRWRFFSTGAKKTNVFQERHFHYDSSVQRIGPPVFLKGYFQSPEYFLGSEELLRSEFKLKDEGGDAFLYWRSRIAGKNGISLHVRRGDFLESGITSVHGVLPTDYYERALALIDCRSSAQAEVFVFTDDPEWVKANLKVGRKFELISGSKMKPIEEMTLMAMCANHVIANSTFSWWGAWLNPDVSKSVVAPRRWFSAEAARRMNTADLFPQGWLLL